MSTAPTLRSIADESGLSIATVSKILHGGYGGTTAKGRARVESVTAIAHRRGYLANGSARRLRDGRHRAVLVVTPVDPEGHAGLGALDWLTGIGGALAAAGHAMIVHPRQRGADAPIAVERRFDGVLVLDETDEPLTRFLASARVPAVHVNAAAAPGVVAVRRDDAAAAGALVDELVRLGYRRLHVVGARDGHPAYVDRARGIDAAVARHRLPCERVDRAWWHRDLPAILAARPPAREAAIVAVDAHTALVLMPAIGARALACCDDCHLFRELFPELTRARFDRLGLGAMAARLLLARIDGRRLTAPTPAPPLIHVGASTPSLR